MCGGSATGGGNGGGSGGGSATGGGGGSGGGTALATAFCTDVVNAQIDFRVRCGSLSAAGGIERKQTTPTYCTTLPPGFKDGRLSINTTKQQACIAALQALTCTGSLQDLTVCQESIVGTVAASGDCYEDQECVTGFFCDETTTCPGKCTAKLATGMSSTFDSRCLSGWAFNGTCTAPIALGQSCAGGKRCVTGARCNGLNQCEPDVLIAVNQPCAPSGTSCGEGLQCVNDVCIPLVSGGVACDNIRQCQDDLACGPANVCVAPAALGGTCTATTRCSGTLYCNIPATQSSGTCATRKAVDQPCRFGVSECEDALWCSATTTTAGVCKAKVALSGACTFDHAFDSCVSGLYCTATSASSGVCANRKAAGASCTSSNECIGSCVNMTCANSMSCSDPTP